MDAPDRIEGINGVGGIVFDEIGSMKPDVWDYHIQPMTIDNNAWVDFIGVPEGKNHYWDLCQKGIKNETNWGFYTWKTADIIDEQRILDAKKSMPLKAFRQEYEASFEDTFGLCYYAYSNENHTTIEYKPNRKSYLCFDFNINPMSCVLIQQENEKYYCVMEWVYSNNTMNHGIDIREWLIENHFDGELELTGDYTGNAHKTVASADYTDWTILESIFKNFKGYKQNISPCDRHKTRVNALNALFRNALDEIRMYININKCPYLNADLLKVQWKEGGSQIDKGLWRSDISDALSYFAMNYHNIYLDYTYN
jgi:hypothetical protein